MELLRSRTGRVLVAAHRGAKAYAPENTMAAFRLAREQGADAVELDVHLTADDRLVVIHDETLDRTTEGSGWVRDRTWSDIRGLDAGAWFGPRFEGERVPLLEEVLAWAGETGMRLSIELKQPTEALGRARYPDLAAAVIDLVEAFSVTDQVLLFSDDHPTMREVRVLAPHITTSVTLGAAVYLDPIRLAREVGANGVNVHWRRASRSFVEACHREGLHVFGYGVGDDLSKVAEIHAMLANGTDLVSGGQPDQLRALVERWTAVNGPAHVP